MPAAYFWRPTILEPDGVTYSSAVAGNWVNGPGALATPYTIAPGWQDDLYFQGDVSAVNCTIPDLPAPTNSAGLTFNSINLLFGQPLTPTPTPGSPPPPPTPTPYNGIVTIKDSFAVGTLQVDCGTIKQADQAWLTPPVPYAPHAGTLTIKTALDWTGGTLNSNTTLGYIDLAPGATGIAAPSFTNGINQTVGLGSTIRLVGTPVSPTPSIGSALNILSGLYEIANNAEFFVNNQCSFNVTPDADDAPRGGEEPETLRAGVTFVKKESGQTEEQPSGTIIVKEGGTADFKPYERPVNSTAPARFDSAGYLKNEGGNVKIKDTTSVVFSGEFKNSPTSSYSVVQPSAASTATFQIEAGCQIVTKHGTAIGAGTFEILPATRDPGTQIGATVRLSEGSTAPNAFVLTGGTLSMPSPGGVRGLWVVGDFAWAGGTIKLYLATSANLPSDWIHVVGGNLAITNTPTLKLWWNETNMRTMAKDSVWHLIKVEGNQKEITGAYTVDYADVNTQNKIVMDVSTTGNKKEILARKDNAPQ